jgi:formylglycine-generating enzyme required for sulfatase activity
MDFPGIVFYIAGFRQPAGKVEKAMTRRFDPRIVRMPLGTSILPVILCALFTACSPAVTGEPSITRPAVPVIPSQTPTNLEPSPTLEPSLSPTPSETATFAPGSIRTISIDGMVQVYVPAGEFTMGADDKDAQTHLKPGRAYSEVPVHQVTLDSYWFDKFEVTTGQYALCVKAGACQAPHLFTSGYGSAYRPFYYGTEEYKDYPVIWVSWFYAKDYCGWAGRRLPTEAEWEKAARGTDGRKYTWGNDPVSSTVANLCDINCPLPQANGLYNDGFGNTAPVGSFPAGASPYGAMDMAGNVWEWTSSLIKDYPYSATDGREDLTATGERSWRGGSWTNGYWWMRVTLRYRSVDWYWNYNLGFRCASSG